MLHRETLRVLGMKNADLIVPDKDNVKAKDPVTENMNLLNAKPVKAFLYQDHDAHIQVHMAAAQDPAMQKIIGQNPMASVLQQSLQAHLMEHMAFKYRIDIEKQMGVSLPNSDEEMDEEIELKVSRLSAEAAPQVLQMHSQKAAQEAAMQQQQDPTIQAQQQELQLKREEIQLKDQYNKAQLALKTQIEENKDDRERLRIESQEKIAGANIGSADKKHQQQLESDQKVVGFKAGVDLRKHNDQQNIGRTLQKTSAKPNE
jgi:hypothetical protein